ncbi:MAG: patatin-like phospholipase family protein [Pseudomonadota bacterium]
MHRILTIGLIAFSLSACTGERLLSSPPEQVYQAAVVPGLPGIRSYGDVAPLDAEQQLKTIQQQIADRFAAEGKLPNNGRVDILVLSGGGSDGAYGAGLLNGWSDRIGRPEFALVTGISTGALIAPFAFLGSDYDDELERFYTNTGTDDLIDLQIFSALTGRVLGLTNTSKLRETLTRVINRDFLDRIADEHRKGRRLLIGTTNLDAQRPVTWDIGAIAVSDHPKRLRLVRDILLASASIPGAFPPVLFNVAIGNRAYSEMHVDGGVTRQLFALPRGLGLRETEIPGEAAMTLGTIYVVRNTKLAPSFADTEAGIFHIAARSISTLIKSSGVADVGTVREVAREEGFGLALTAVPESFDVPEQDLFDPVYMRALFKVGYDLAFEGEPWETVLEPAE